MIGASLLNVRVSAKAELVQCYDILAVLYCQLNPLSFSMSKTELVDEPVN
jgi:hypothetical protein